MKGKKTFESMNPQPAIEEVIELIGNYQSPKKDDSYKRRVPWLGLGAKANLVLIEYSGEFPGLAPHGNAKEGTEFIRTPANVMKEMTEMLERRQHKNGEGQTIKRGNITDHINEIDKMLAEGNTVVYG